MEAPQSENLMETQSLDLRVILTNWLDPKDFYKLAPTVYLMCKVCYIFLPTSFSIIILKEASLKANSLDRNRLQ